MRYQLKFWLSNDDIGVGFIHSTKPLMTSLKQFLCELASTAYDADGYFIRHNVSATKLGGGCSRTVYQFEFEGKTIAVKFALNHIRRADNRREWRFYHMMPQNVQRMMAKPLAISTCGQLIAFEFIPTTIATCDKLPNDEHYTDVTEGFNLKLREQLDKFFVDNPRQTRWVTSDNHANNVGIKENGDLAWIDYACAWY